MTPPKLPLGFVQPARATGEPDMDAILANAVQQTLQDAGVQPSEQATQSQANAIVAPNKPESDTYSGGDDASDALMTALYGSDFPKISMNTEDDASWVSWCRGRWAAHRAAVEKHLHMTERNRLFRYGQQWVSSRGRGPWREPMKPTDSARVVYNMIDKALDQRLQIITDQRPGFKVQPMTMDPGDKRKAEARQIALEYQYDSQNMEQAENVACYFAQTDGIAFYELFWNPDKGPWDERMGDGQGGRKPLGDLDVTVRRVEQVRVSANATRSEEPYYYVIRDVIPATEAAYKYGLAGVQASAQIMPVMGTGDVATDAGMNRWVLDQTIVGEGDRLRNQDVVERYTVYIAPQADVLPDGLQLVTVGDAVVWGPKPLLFGVIPVIPQRDGSTDPSFYPRPIMEQWIDHQVRINALVSAIVDSVRVNKSGRFLSRPGAITAETFVGGGTSILEVNGIGSLDDIVRPVNGFSVGQDVISLLQLEKKAFEDASGWNDTSRGQISSDASGRAILAAREQLERIFAPPVQARAIASTQWAKVSLAGMAWGYDVPRNLGAVGKNRPDLARELERSDFEGMADVKVEASTLMPMPSTYRQFILDQLLEKQLITPQQYLRRLNFAVVSDLDSPDEDQEARAKRVADALRTGSQVPEVRWQDNEAIHQDVLEREIILQDDIDPQIIALAQERWSQLAQQAQEKQGGAPPAPSGPPQQGGPSHTPPHTGQGGPPPAMGMPMGGPMGPATAQHAAAQQFEASAPQ